MLLWIQSGAEEISASGTSFLNRAEAAAAERVVTHLLKAGVTPAQIGVITPYQVCVCCWVDWWTDGWMDVCWWWMTTERMRSKRPSLLLLINLSCADHRIPPVCV